MCSISGHVSGPLTQRANSREISNRFNQNANAQLFPGHEEAVEDRTKGGVITGEILELTVRSVDCFAKHGGACPQ